MLGKVMENRSPELKRSSAHLNNVLTHLQNSFPLNPHGLTCDAAAELGSQHTNIFGCCSFDEAHSIAEAHRIRHLQRDRLQTPRPAQPGSKWEAIANDARSTQVNAHRSGECREPAYLGRAPGFILALIIDPNAQPPPRVEKQAEARGPRSSQGQTSVLTDLLAYHVTVW